MNAHLKWLPILSFALAGCGLAGEAARPAEVVPPTLQPVTVEQIQLDAPAQPCANTFVAHDLDHVTSVPGAPARMFEGNGTGVAIGDIDDDGRLDVVLANHQGSNTILWNE